MSAWDFLQPRSEPEQATTPRQRAAQTKRMRSAETLRSAADKVIRQNGLAARAEDIAEMAGVSLATYYNNYSSRADMFIDLADHFIFEPARSEAEYHPKRVRAIQSYIYAVRKNADGRSAIVRGFLMARQEKQLPTDVGYMTWGTKGSWSDYDPLLKVLYFGFVTVINTSFEDGVDGEDDIPSLTDVEPILTVSRAILLELLDMLANDVDFDTDSFAELVNCQVVAALQLALARGN